LYHVQLTTETCEIVGVGNGDHSLEWIIN